ncbi:cell wall-binding repeat-containing protein [Desulfosporosinus metallidurans]|uniref:N-acetylmuramoyl-L-alanine amidase n=1 Tax=Desulfosporosinus metallidurans TaxID=1888891 RepID=A0A1Q8QFX0_9FIRM|nr:cell wall-binding repeat-containing protein [Desulfosporosinus metallidurans]OLN26247.1 N-acetylmuramoyl-L-alanine amidase [Desulfosporosinus metallidurans]
MYKKNIARLTLPFFLIPLTFGCTPAQAQTAQPVVANVQNVQIQGAVGNRLSGQDRFQTAKAISEQVNSGTVQDVLITSGNNFPDALSASVLAKKLNAPILLVDSSTKSSDDALKYIIDHLSKTGTVHIIGGTGIVSGDFETLLKQMSSSYNIDRIGGYDRYDTDVLIAQKLNVAKNTPVVIASGENFPDALSISSVASSKGYPILLVGSSMSQGVMDFITNDQPSQVYIVGGNAVVSDSIKAQVQSLAPSTLITRLAGNDRFDTAGQIASTFSLNPKTLYLASGMNFPDALAGSALASITGDPIILIDPTTMAVPPAIEAYLKKLHDANIHPNIVSFGGTVVVPDAIVQNVENILNGVAQVTELKMTSTWTSDPVANIKAICNELGLENGGTGASFDPVPKFPVISVVSSRANDGTDAYINFLAWEPVTQNQTQEGYGKIKPIAKELFRFYSPTGYTQLYNMVDASWGGSYAYSGKTYNFDNREYGIRIDDSSNSLTLFISKPGQKLPPLKGVNM